MENESANGANLSKATASRKSGATGAYGVTSARNNATTKNRPYPVGGISSAKGMLSDLLEESNIRGLPIVMSPTERLRLRISQKTQQRRV